MDTSTSRSVLVGLWLSAVVLVAAAPTLSAQDRSRYRDFQLGASLAAVTGQSGASAADVKTIHQRPALLQDLKGALVFGELGGCDARGSRRRDSLQFRRQPVVSPRRRLRPSPGGGMTRTDMIEAISATYGAAVLVPGAGLEVLSANGQPDGTIIARWTDADNTVDLLRPAYGDGFRLMVTSRRLDTVARKAVTEARRLDEREAPQRELARARKDADDKLAAQEKARAANKSTFKP